MAGVHDAIWVFALEHKGCGELRGDADPIASQGYRGWARCACGGQLEAGHVEHLLVWR